MTVFHSSSMGTLLLFAWLNLQLILIWAGEMVYFDKFGDCTRLKPFDLDDETYIANAAGGGLSHERLDCTLTFRSDKGQGVCVTFNNFNIEDCGTRLLVYGSKKPGKRAWKEFDCESFKPTQLCTSERYVTLRVNKDRRNYNKGYTFAIRVEESSRVTGEGVVFASIGFLVGIICGVVGFLVIMALIIYFCCFKKRNGNASSKLGANHAGPMEPSAPPLLEPDGTHINMEHIYPRISQQQQQTTSLESPPPYEQPPSYTLHDNRRT